MVILHRGSVFEYDTASPSTVSSGSKSRSAKRWKYCPYSTQSTTYNQDSRVPQGEKTYHPETEGMMHSYSVNGVMGWACADNACSYFLSTATTTVTQHGRKFVAVSGTVGTTEALATLSGSVQHLQSPRTIVSGTRQRYYEI